MAQTVTVDATRLRRGLLILFFIVLTVVLFHFGIKRNLPILGMFIPFLAILSLLVGRPSLLLIILLVNDYARLKVPWLPVSLNIPAVFQVLLIGWAMLDASVTKQKRVFSFVPTTDVWMVLFGINVLLLMLVRGTGFALLGSSTFGGSSYIMLALWILVYFAAVRLNLTNKQVRIIIWATLIASFIPALTEILIYYYESAFWGLTRYVSTGAGKLLTEKYKEAAGTERWGSLGNMGWALIPIAYVLCRKKNTRLILIILAIALTGLTGSRNRIFGIGAMAFFTSVYYSRSRIKAIVVWALAGLIVLVFLMVATPMLPRAVQRAVSFVPFLPVDADIVERAARSSGWRFDMWRDYCLPNVPRYLLLGRGIASEISGFAWLQASWYGTAEFFYQMHGYHSGPFSLLLDYGLPGTISFTVFFILVISDGWRTVRQYASHQNTIASRYYIYLTLLMTYEVFRFYLIFGAVHSGLFRYLMIAAQMRIIKKNFLMEPAGAGVQAVETPQSTSLQPLKPHTNQGATRRTDA